MSIMQIIERVNDIVVLINDLPTYEIEKVTGKNDKDRTVIWGKSNDKKMIARVEYKKPDYNLSEVEKIVLIDKEYDDCPNCIIGKPIEEIETFSFSHKASIPILTAGGILAVSIFAVVINKWWNKN